MFRNTLTFFLILILSTSYAQEDSLSLTLQESIEIALKNNLDLRRAELREKTSKVSLRQTWGNLYPNLNGRINAGINNGRSIDPFTNQYIDEQLTFSNAGLSLNATVFNGFRIINSIKRDKYNLEASEFETEEAKQDLILNVTLAYLQALNNVDLVKIAKARLVATGEQIARVKELYELGEGNPADYTDIRGQLASDRATIVRLENALVQSLLNLSQLMNVEYLVNPVTTELPADLQEYNYTSQEVFDAALNNLAAFKARELRIDAARKNVHVARALYVPELAFFAQLNTNYSSAARLFNETGTVLTETGGFVTIDDQEFPVRMNQMQFAGEEIQFMDQFNNNLNSVIGLALDIPLFNGFRARNNVALQKIRLEEARIDLEGTKLEFLQSIEEAHVAMEAAYDQYLIFQEQVEAFSESYRVNEIRFNSGLSNIVEYIISKNNLDNALINLANAKYEYLLRVQVLEYFRGKI